MWLDLYILMTERKSRFILTIMDVAIRYAGAFPLRRVDTETLLGALFEFFLDYRERMLGRWFSDYNTSLSTCWEFDSVWKQTTRC